MDASRQVLHNVEKRWHEKRPDRSRETARTVSPSWESIAPEISSKEKNRIEDLAEDCSRNGTCATKEMTCRWIRQGGTISLVTSATKEMACRWIRQRWHHLFGYERDQRDDM